MKCPRCSHSWTNAAQSKAGKASGALKKLTSDEARRMVRLRKTNPVKV